MIWLWLFVLAVIAYVAVCTIIGNRRKIRNALELRQEDALQYPFRIGDTQPHSAMKVLPAKVLEEKEINEILAPISQGFGSKLPETEQAWADYLTCRYCGNMIDPGEHDSRCPKRIADELLGPGDEFVDLAEVTSDDNGIPYLSQADRAYDADLRAQLDDEEGEPLLTPAMPNIGGEGHPPYKGPTYNATHISEELPELVPYDVLGDPLPGVAVHIVEQGKHDADDLDSNREQPD